MFHSQGLRYLLWTLIQYIHRLPCLICSDYHQKNLFVKDRVWAGCWGYSGLKINWSLRSIQFKYFILFDFISVHLISSIYLLLFHITISFQFRFNFISISFQFHFNFISIFFQFSFIFSFIFLLYFILFNFVLFILP